MATKLLRAGVPSRVVRAGMCLPALLRTPNATTTLLRDTAVLLCTQDESSVGGVVWGKLFDSAFEAALDTVDHLTRF